MTTAAEYRQYARECLDSASDAISEDLRNQFLEIAKLWMLAAARLDGGVVHTNGRDEVQLGHAPVHGEFVNPRINASGEGSSWTVI